MTVEISAPLQGLIALENCFPGVVYTGETVFKSDEALELEQKFQAVIDPTDEGKVKVALITRMMGVSGEDLARIIEDETEWERWLTRFDEYRLLWLRAGFIEYGAHVGVA